MSSKKKNTITVDFSNAEASEHVTGSMYHVKAGDLELLLDCGLAQSNNILKDYRANNAHFKFKAKNIKYIFLSHLHLDHSQRVSLLYKRGCEATIIMPKGSKRIFKDMAEDTLHIFQKDSEVLSKQCGKKYEPIFGPEDVKKALDHIVEYDFNEILELENNLKFRFTPSGHIICGAQIELWITNNNTTKKILYTGDLGNVFIKKDYITPFEPVEKANLVIGETTYGDKTRAVSTLKQREKDLEKIEEIIRNTCVKDKARVLIPCFALDRLQTMLTILYEIFGKDEDFKIPILVDTPLGLKHIKSYFNILENEDLEKFSEVISWKNIIQIKEYPETKYWAEECDTPCVILAASGCLVSGRAISYIPNILSYWRNHILFCGFLPEGTLGWKIKNSKSKYIKINDKISCRNQCYITALTSFSSHMQYPSLLKYYSNINSDKIALVHGQMDTKLSFQKDLQEELSRKNKTTKVICVNSGTKINL